MARLLVIGLCAVGWLVLAGGIVAPLAGVFLAAGQSGAISTELVAVPAWQVLLLRSLVMSLTTTVAAVALGLLPAAVLGSASPRRLPTLVGLALLPLLVPPQVYAYAWQLVSAPASPLRRFMPDNVSDMWFGGAIRAGLISAGWLWPLSAMILAAGWRSAGRTAFALALLDAGPTRAYLRAVVPSLRPHLMAAATTVFAVSLLEYAIPHLTRCRIYATELLVLVDAGAPAGQIIRMAVQVIAILMVLVALVVWIIRPTAHWGQVGMDDETANLARPGRTGIQANTGRLTWAGAALVWVTTLGVPVGIMSALKPGSSSWAASFSILSREWLSSLSIALAAGMAAIAMASGTAMLDAAARSRWARTGGWTTFLAAAIPPAALGVGFILIYNRPGFVGYLYTDTPCVWILSLVSRYGALAVLIVWLTVGRQGNAVADQARADGAGAAGILAHVLLPMVWPSLLAAGLIVTMLAMFEVVVTQMTGPVGYPSIAVTLLGQMHYGRDNVVITTSQTVVVAGFVLTQICGRLLMAARER
ncbi:MAG TPA: hypothetical protein PLL20_17400 [Phycisphaerae bacterium]|nr:hypothetical protein [Phycisphaerae bacterium]HRR86535.1 hypothetical protein [Phycisphaerae bacterium]